MQRALSRQEHDEFVQHVAVQLLAHGFDVKARVEGWFTEPEYIFEYRPDIVACRNDECVIIEVKKAESDWPKIAALERFAQEMAGYAVRVVTPGDDLSDLFNSHQRDQRVVKRA